MWGLWHTLILPNAPDQRPRASDAKHGPETLSRGSLHPVCSAIHVSCSTLASDRQFALENNSDETPSLAKIVVGKTGQSGQRIADNHFRVGHFQNSHPMILQ